MSMGFYAYKNEGNRYEFAFPSGWMEELIYPENFDHGRWINDEDYELEPIQNMAYRPYLNLHLANDNMVYIMRDVLGFEGDSADGFLVPVDNFLTKAQVWLQKRLGQTTPVVEGYEHPQHVSVVQEGNVSRIQRGARVFEGGRREGYDEQTIHQMVQIAHEGKQCGATHIGAA